MRARRLAVGVLLASLVVLALPSAVGAANPWVRVAVPNPGSDRNILLAVSCTSASTCTAVGYFSNDSGVFPLVSRTSDGSLWTRVNVPRPSPLAQINDVSCTTAVVCTAVGTYAPVPGNGTFTLRTWIVRTTNGTTWSRIASPNVGNGLNELTSVSCITATRCRAVGHAGSRTVILRTGNGTDWFRQPSPNPGNGDNLLRSIDCVNNTHCTAVGGYYATAASGAYARSLVLNTTDGRSWDWIPTPNPAPNQSDSPLGEVSCVGPRCVAVGLVKPTPAGGVRRAFILRTDSGVSWERLPTPTVPRDVELQSVDCSSTTECTAVGYDLDPAEHFTLRLLRTTDGASWSSPDPTAEKFGRLPTSVSCGTPVTCVAVGAYNATADTDDPLKALVIRET